MGVKSQSEFDSRDDAFKIYKKGEAYPKEKSKFIDLAKENRTENKENKHPKK